MGAPAAPRSAAILRLRGGSEHISIKPGEPPHDGRWISDTATSKKHLNHCPSNPLAYTTNSFLFKDTITMLQNQAVKIVEQGNAQVVDVPLPELPHGYMLVKVTAVAINPTDWKHIEYADSIPCVGSTVGCDYAGVVEQVGEGGSKVFKKGDRVTGLINGSYVSEDPGRGEFVLTKRKGTGTGHPTAPSLHTQPPRSISSSLSRATCRMSKLRHWVWRPPPS